ncbi:MAG: hypothetical protein JSW64_01090 [Candidatus Zixiibacteriota bacterium]|nr:MAG: hypothetical protein JSW64_01090 [candidate division Zixibacteria bacterium]
MKENLNLKELERKAYRATFQDGFLDITLGLFLIGSAIAGLFQDNKPVRLIITVIIILVPLAIFLLGKKKITVPRIGMVKFGAERKARKKKVAAIILMAVIISSLLALMAMTHSMPIFLAELLKGFGSAVGFGLLAFTMFIFGGYYNDIPRLYLYGLLFGASLFLSECYYNKVGIEVHSSVWFGASGLIMLSIGISLLIRFIRLYPVPSEERTVEGE